MPQYAIGLLTISTLHVYVDRNGSYCRKVLANLPYQFNLLNDKRVRWSHNVRPLPIIFSGDSLCIPLCIPHHLQPQPPFRAPNLPRFNLPLCISPMYSPYVFPYVYPPMYYPYVFPNHLQPQPPFRAPNLPLFNLPLSHSKMSIRNFLKKFFINYFKFIIIWNSSNIAI